MGEHQPMGNSPRRIALSASYNAERNRIVIELSGGMELAFDPAAAEGLARASKAQLSRIEISPSGEGLHWPELDADLLLPALLEGKLGSARWMSLHNSGNSEPSSV